MQQTTVGRLLIDDALPQDLRRSDRVLDSKGIKALFQEVAEKYPEQYADIALKLTKLGHDFAYSKGGLSFGVEHLRTAKTAKIIRAKIEEGVERIAANPSLSDQAKEDAIIKLTSSFREPLEAGIFQESLDEGNPLAHQILSGVRGNKTNLRSLRGGDLLYVDHRNRTIPVPVVHSYSEGLRPAEYWSSTFGARAGVISTKKATADSGFLSKILTQAAHRLIVTAKDAEEQDASGEPRGMPVAADDPGNVGALLGHAAGGFKRNTLITPKVLKQIKDQGIERILVRSPIVGGPPEGGVYSRDVGVREKGTMAPIGDYVGHAAAQALSEKLTQSQLQSKHSGGVSGANAATSGFKAIFQLVNPPKIYPGAATHAQQDGLISKIAEAPQGGFNVFVDGKSHYVPADLPLQVKSGDRVEAGDTLSEGMPNPAEVVKHKGIGEGRRYFVDAMRKTYANTGMHAERRNIELLARGLIDHVRLTEELGPYVPDDVVPYSAVERDWEPREGTMTLAPHSALNKYLERPVLHYSIGSRITPSVAGELSHFGVGKVAVHRDPPPFVPEMQRGVSALQHDPEWAVRHLGSGIAKGTLQAAQRGSTTDTAGTSFVSSLAMDPTHFGRQGLTKGWDPNTLGDDDLLD